MQWQVLRGGSPKPPGAGGQHVTAQAGCERAASRDGCLDGRRAGELTPVALRGGGGGEPRAVGW